MNRSHGIAIAAILICSLLFAACRLQQGTTPSISVDSPATRTGLALRVSGWDWVPGTQVIIGLSESKAQPERSTDVTTATTDATGAFVALLLLPADPRWLSLSEIWVVAHTRDFGKVAIASFHNSQTFTATPSPRPTTIASLTIEPAIYVLGYVQEVSVASRTIKVKPVEGQIKTVVIGEGAQLTYAGQPAQLAEINSGDLIEASGTIATKDTLTARQVRILTRVQPTVQPTSLPTATMAPIVWQGEYYNNTTFSGNPVLVRHDPVIDFQWQGGAAANGLPADNFAVRWTGTWPFEAGVYRFYTQVDDGVRLAVDEHWIIDRWHESTGALYTADAYLSAGRHTVKVEYFEARSNAVAKVWWEYRGPEAKQTFADWKGEYYSNATLSGSPFLVINERTLDFNWGRGVPATGMPTDDFSARWTRTVNLEAGVYRLYAQADDGVRLWVDEVLLMDHWLETAVQTYSVEQPLSKANHNIRVEYFEKTGEAVIRVWWELLPATPTPTLLPETPTHTPPPPTMTPTLTPMPPAATPTPTEVVPEPSPEATP
jgi:hypothetical protein